MKRTVQAVLIVLLLLLPVGWLRAEKPSDLPIPTTYVNDFAHVLTPAGAQKIESLCLEVQQKADAQLFVVTIKTLDGGMSKEEFTDQLEEKWKAGKKGQDRGAIILLVLNPRGTRIETGYGLEGILNDAKVGAILDQADPVMKSGDYDDGLYAAVQGMGNVIAADKGVTLTAPVHTYRYVRQQAPPQKMGLGQILIGVGFVVLIIILAKTGNLGWAIYLVMSLMGGGGGGRDDDDRGGGGFGGIGGGSSGGGGASRDF
jgi:uncharacterized protein